MPLRLRMFRRPAYCCCNQHAAGVRQAFVCVRACASVILCTRVRGAFSQLLCLCSTTTGRCRVASPLSACWRPQRKHTEYVRLVPTTATLIVEREAKGGVSWSTPLRARSRFCQFMVRSMERVAAPRSMGSAPRPLLSLPVHVARRAAARAHVVWYLWITTDRADSRSLRQTAPISSGRSASRCASDRPWPAVSMRACSTRIPMCRFTSWASTLQRCQCW